MFFQDKVQRPRNTKVLHRVSAHNPAHVTSRSVTLVLNDEMKAAVSSSDVTPPLPPHGGAVSGHHVTGAEGVMMKHSVSTPLLQGAWSGRRLENAIEPQIIENLSHVAGLAIVKEYRF